jgi:hypothetical protein
LPFALLLDPVVTPVSSKMLVNVKVISHNGLELTHRKTHLLGSNQEAKVAIFEKCDMQTSWGAPQSGMKSEDSQKIQKAETYSNGKQQADAKHHAERKKGDEQRT